jgi:hypothetical protein
MCTVTESFYIENSVPIQGQYYTGTVNILASVADPMLSGPLDLDPGYVFPDTEPTHRILIA